MVSPAGEAHGFTNTGSGELRLIAIHGAGPVLDGVARGPGHLLGVDAEGLIRGTRLPSAVGSRPPSSRRCDDTSVIAGTRRGPPTASVMRLVSSREGQ